MGERLPYKQRVSGSSPLASTIVFGGIAKRLNAADCNSVPIGFGSSNLSSSTIAGVVQW